jgi:hypothetical protein
LIHSETAGYKKSFAAKPFVKNAKSRVRLHRLLFDERYCSFRDLPGLCGINRDQADLIEFSGDGAGKSAGRF